MALAGREIHSPGQALCDHSFFIAEFVPAAQLPLAAARAALLRLIVQHLNPSGNSINGFFVLI
jgi:hypothetical protein